MSSEQIWDPLRKKNVALTPEEKVRQWFIGVMQSQMKIPVTMMMSEVGFKFGEGSVKKDYRADILVYDRGLKPLMVVECKRPEVELTARVVEQAMRYNMVLDVRFIVVTNGNGTFLFGRKGEKFEPLDHIPDYEEMLKWQL